MSLGNYHSRYIASHFFRSEGISMRKNYFLWTLLFVILGFSLMTARRAPAENPCTSSPCDGAACAPVFPIPSNPQPPACHHVTDCDGKCVQVQCRDMSDDGDNVDYCCMIAETACVAAAPELPSNAGPFTLAFGMLFVAVAWYKMKQRKVKVGG